MGLTKRAIMKDMGLPTIDESYIDMVIMEDLQADDTATV